MIVYKGLLLLLLLLEFFSSVLPDGLSLEFEWQQVSSSLQDSSQYSGWSLDGLHSSSNFQVLYSLWKSFSYWTESANDNWYNCHPYVFSIPKQGRGTYPSFHILSDLYCGQPGQQSSQFCKFSFLCVLIIIRSRLLAEIRWSVCMSKSHRSLCESFSRTDTGLYIYHLFV